MPSLLMRLITQVTSLDTSSVLMKRFPRSGFFSFGNKSKAGGLMSGLSGGWGKHLPFIIFQKFPILHLRHEAARWCMITDHCARSDSSQFLLPFQGSILQNTDHVACQYSHTVLYWSLAHNCRENQNDCIILLAEQAQCAELLKWPTYNIIQGYYKRNRHFQRYVVSKPLA